MISISKTGISISNNRVAIELENRKTVQLVVWDLKPTDHHNLKTQIDTGFSICSNFEDVIKHLKINGFDADLEDIY